MNVITLARAARDGSAGVGEKLGWQDVYPDQFVEGRIAPAWELAEQLAVERLGGFGDVYVTVLVAGGRFPRRRESDRIVMRRGPLLAGVVNEQAASLGREFMHAVGNYVPEP